MGNLVFVRILLLALSLWLGEAIALPKSISIPWNSLGELPVDQENGQPRLASLLKKKLHDAIANNENSSPDQLGIHRTSDDCEHWIQSYDPPYISSETISEIFATSPEGSTLKNNILQCLQARFGTIEIITDAIERDCSYSQQNLPSM